MTETNPTSDTSNQPSIQSSLPTKLEQGSQQRTTLQVETKPVETKEIQEETTKLALPGNRPIGKTNLKYSKTISNRPIVSNSLKINHTMSASGIRPVVDSGLEFNNTITASGVRPIGTNNLEVSKILMNRPVASNGINSEDLMGFLD